MQPKEAEMFYSTVVDKIVDMVWKRFPDDEKSRMYTYDRLAESFVGLVKVFNSQTGTKFEVPKEEEQNDSES